MWRAAVQTSHPFLDTSDVDSYETIVSEVLPQMADLRVAVDQKGQVLGFLAQDAGEIHMLFVEPAAQNGGIGTALLEGVAPGFGVLRVDVNEQNPTARAFYAARGFTEVGRSAIDGQGRPFPLLHLRREHAPGTARPSTPRAASEDEDAS